MSPRLSTLRTIRRLRDDDRGVTLVELAMSIALFLLLFFALLDIGRLAYNYVTAEKALQIAARMAVVRPPICNGLPATNQRGANTDPRFGAKCTPGVCVAVNPFPCTGADAGLGIAGNATADEIWARVRGLMPNGATEANLRYTYSYDEDVAAMNFLGGPYVPLVTVELVGLDFEFLGILAGLARVAGATDTDTEALEETETDGISFGLSVSLPGEDLALGTNG